MQTFSQILLEAQNTSKMTSSILTVDEIDKYVNAVKKQLTKSILDIIYLTKKYQLFDGERIKEILDCSKGSLQKLANDNVSVEELIDLQKQLQALKTNIRLLPQMQSIEERESLMTGKILASDLTIDLSTPAGRNAVAKQYMKLVYKIASQFEGRCSFDKAELISIGMHSLAEAIEDFDPSKTNKPFKTYAAYRIRQGILGDINEFSHSLSGTNWYAAKHYGDKLDAVSIDSLSGPDDDDDFSSDHLAALGVSDDLRWIDVPKSEQEYWETLFKIIDSKFTVKERNIFYRFFGLGEFWGKKEKSKDIAKSYGMSEGNIRNSIINKILKFLKNDPKSKNILQSLRTIYCESLMKELVYFTDKKYIYETLINDDMFILLEELNKWSNKNVLLNAVSNALAGLKREDATYITKCLNEGFNYIDDTYKKHKSVIVAFLQVVYPTESFTRVSDVYIIDKMTELHDASKDHQINW